MTKLSHFLCTGTSLPQPYIALVLQVISLAPIHPWKPRACSSHRQLQGLANTSRMRRFALIALAAMVLATGARADILEGSAVVLSGDTIELQGEEIRLLGIDAPETTQTCWDAAGATWPCGERAMAALSDRIADAILTCKGIRRDHEKRLIAVCRIGDENLNAWLVAAGWALAYRSQSTAYVAAEEAARESASGLWAGAFEPPWVWRTKH